MLDLLAFIVVVALIIYGVLWFQRKSNAAFSDPGNSKAVVTDATRHKLEDEMKKKAQSMDHELLILYATQTGTAQTFCKTLYKEAERYGVKAALFDVENFPQDQLEKEKIVCFVVATYGEGEPPDSGKAFHEFFMGDTAPQLKDTKFAVFGLGDKQYTHFCEMGKLYNKRAEELGATRICDVGLGDASTDIEVEFDMWRSTLWPAVGNALGRQLKCDSDEPQLPETTLRYLDGEEPAAYPFPKAAASIAPNLRQPAWVPIKEHKSLLKKKVEAGRETMLINFDISGTALTYQAGDHLAILPHNSDETLQRYMDLLKISPEEGKRVIALADIKTKRNQLPAWVTIRDALKWYTDLCGKPKRSVLRVFAHYSKTPAQRDELLSLLRMSQESQAAFHKEETALRDIGGFIKKYECDIPIGHFLEVMPRLQPRWFSIASDQLLTKTELHVVVAVVDRGVCTTMLQNMKVGQECCVYVRKSTFHLNRQYKTRPIICVGPGTGLAPLVGFMARREAWKSKNSELGRCFLYFGCRRRDEDYIYEEQLERWNKEGIITDLHVAFSRDQEEKVYVQHLIAKHAQELWKLISEEQATFYICGDARRMAHDVQLEMKKMAMTYGNKTEDEALAYFDKMEKDSRFLKDVWSG